MRYGFCSGDKRRISARGRIGIVVFLLTTAVLFSGPAMAIETKFLGNPLGINGYIDQGIQFGIAGDHFDTKSGFQQALTQALLEMDYYPAEELKFFVSGLLIKDWAYDILEDDDDWKDRHFDESRSELSLYSDYEDYLKECHITWGPGDFNFRVGKQIVSWGRMTAVRVMDQINPRDTRRGAADVQFETSIIPIWLVKAEYFAGAFPGFFNDLTLELTFNPNADFIGNKGYSTGNDKYGIWSANVTQSILGTDDARIWSLIEDIDEPDSWNSDGFEYGVRLKGLLADDTYFTLNFFDGVKNSPTTVTDTVGTASGVLQVAPGVFIDNPGIPLNGLPLVDDKGRQLWQSYSTGKYFDQTFAGFTFAHEFESLNVSWLGGVAPLLRCEALYEFDSTFATAGKGTPTVKNETFEEYDAIYWGMAVEWDVSWHLLNPRRNITFEPGFANRHIMDYPSSYRLDRTPENLYQCTIMASTQYMHDKLTPRIVYTRVVARDSNQDRAYGDIWVISLDYEPNETWSYGAQLYLQENDLMDPVHNSNNIAFTVQYQF